MQYHDDEIRSMIAAGTRDDSGLCPELRGLEGCRVEATQYDARERFQVGVSGGWKPCHLRLHNARSMGGDAITLGSPVSNVYIVRRAR